MENLTKVRPCLAELSFDVALDAVLIAQGPLSVEVTILIDLNKGFFVRFDLAETTIINE